MSIQGIIDPTGTEIFAEETKLVKLFWELKSTLVRRLEKKVYWFFSPVSNTKFVAFWCFDAVQHVNGCLFANTDVFFYWSA